jgi:hypothetical protein
MHLKHTNSLLNQINTFNDHIASLSETLSQDILDSDLVILPYNTKNLQINDFAKLPKPRFLRLNRIQNLPSVSQHSMKTDVLSNLLTGIRI